MTERANPVRYILIGIPVLFLIGALFHFIYEYTGKIYVIGLFTPVNESVFEHVKMVVLPVVAWWTIYYFVKQDSIWANTWFTAALISLVISMISVPLLFYFYTQAFGIESVIVDVLLLLISLSIGQLVGLVFYKNGEGIPSSWSVLIMVFIVAMCALATICPPHLPLFYDEMGGLYGMK